MQLKLSDEIGHVKEDIKEIHKKCKYCLTYQHFLHIIDVMFCKQKI